VHHALHHIDWKPIWQFHGEKNWMAAANMKLAIGIPQNIQEFPANRTAQLRNGNNGFIEALDEPSERFTKI
jgi:hypothetical protein